MPYCSHCNFHWVGTDSNYCPNCGKARGGCGTTILGAIGCGFLLLVVGGCAAFFGILPKTVTTTGTLVLKNDVPVGQGVQAWVEADGVKVADWPVGTTEVSIVLPAGTHRITVKMIFAGASKVIYDQPVTITVNGRTEVVVGK